MKKLISILKIVLPLGLGFFLIYLFYNKLSPDDIAKIKASLRSANYGWLLVSSLFTLLSQLVRAQRWKSLVNATGANISFLKSFNAISVNYFVNLGIPRAGEVARCGVIATYDGVPVNKSIGTLINERIIDVIFLFVTGVLTFVLQYQIFTDFYQQYLADKFDPILNKLLYYPFITILVGIVMAIVGFFVLRKLLNNNSKAESRLGKIIQGFKDGILSIFRIEKPFVFILQSILIWVGYFFMIYFAFKTTDATAYLGFGATLALLFFGTFGFLATPGGIGAYPLIVGYLLSFYGLEEIMGSTLGWLLWIGQTLLIIALGLFAFIILGREKNKNPLVFTNTIDDENT